MKAEAEFQKLLDLIQNNESFLLTAHQDPDGDSIGSLIGLNNFLKKQGKQTVVYSQGRLPDKYKFLDPDSEINFIPEPLKFKPQIAIILECTNLERTGFVKDFITDNMVLVNIDHHSRNTMYGHINLVDESACAVAEILFCIFREGGYKITPDIAEPFYAAIASDTGRFKFTNTDAKCFLAVSELVKAGANPKHISDKIFSSFSAGTLRLLGSMLKRLELYDNGTICVLKLTRDDLNKYNVHIEDTEGIIDYSLNIKGVKVGILFKEFDQSTVKVGLRSQNSIDISKYARQRGGGGHPNASGFTVGDQFDAVVSSVVNEVSEYLNG